MFKGPYTIPNRDRLQEWDQFKEGDIRRGSGRAQRLVHSLHSTGRLR